MGANGRLNNIKIALKGMWVKRRGVVGHKNNG